MKESKIAEHYKKPSSNTILLKDDKKCNKKKVALISRYTSFSKKCGLFSSILKKLFVAYFINCHTLTKSQDAGSTFYLHFTTTIKVTTKVCNFANFPNPKP